ncbi:hypothetical protein ES705_29511 [subsurface metagenome]
MKIKCPLCDFENEEGNKFCKNCNEPLYKQDYSEDNPYIKKKGNEDQPFELISSEEDEEDEIRNKIEKEEKIRAEVKSEIEGEKYKRLNNVYKCPKCNATIEEGLKLCGNCKAEIVWKDGKPKLSAAYAMQKVGCALTQLGCLIPLLIIFAFAAYVIIASLLGD